MPVFGGNIDFGSRGIQTGADIFRNSGLVGPRQPDDFNNAGMPSSILTQALQVGQFGLDVFNTVSGRNNPPAATIPTASSSSSTVPVPANISRIQTGNFSPGSGSSVRPAAVMLGNAPMAAIRAGVSFVLRKIKANTGLRITTKKIVAAIRQFGPSAVASWGGVSMEELMVVWDRGSRRVKRRFTKRDRARGRSYIRHLKRCGDELKSLGCGPRSRSPRRR